jgi:hypothetical protein
MKKVFNKKNIVKLLTKIQDEGGVEANIIATQAIEDFGLESLHKQLQDEYAKKYAKKKAKKLAKRKRVEWNTPEAYENL